MVYHRHLVERTTFRNLRFGERFFITLGNVAPPLVKLDRRHYAGLHAGGIVTAVAAPATNVVVFRFPKATEPYDGSLPRLM